MDWVDEIIVNVRGRKALIDMLEPGIPETLRKLRAVIENDIERLNSKVYEGRSVFEVEDAPVSFYDFRVVKGNSKFEAQVRLRAEDAELVCSKPHSGGGFRLDAIPDQSGEISFFEGNRLVTPEEISRLLIEDTVRAEFRI